MPTTGYPEHRTVYLSGLLTGLTPNQDYTYVLLGANGPIAELGSEFPASADGRIGYNQVSLDLTENVVDSTPMSFELRDQAGTVVGHGTTPVVVYANLQSDGNLVIRDIHYRPVWTSGTAGHPGATLTLQTDSNVVIRDASGRAVWSTGVHR